MKYKYEFEADELIESVGFAKGNCDFCPLSYYEETPYGYDCFCVLHKTYDECPLIEVEE